MERNRDTGVRMDAVTFGVERRFYRGKVARPKSEHGRRTLRLTRSMTQTLWLRRRSRPRPDDLVWTTARGGCRGYEAMRAARVHEHSPRHEHSPTTQYVPSL